MKNITILNLTDEPIPEIVIKKLKAYYPNCINFTSEEYNEFNELTYKDIEFTEISIDELVPLNEDEFDSIDEYDRRKLSSRINETHPCHTLIPLVNEVTDTITNNNIVNIYTDPSKVRISFIYQLIHNLACINKDKDTQYNITNFNDRFYTNIFYPARIEENIVDIKCILK